ncbi:hypothetical protein [Rhizobium cauense]|uniref:hypothetical protein n=1 Tax=Rhizobium cauense TaxID=1166683 RepID=UPI0030B89D77
MDVRTDIRYGGIRAELEAAVQTIGLNDLMIAAHACTLNMTLVTGNVREFQRVRGPRGTQCLLPGRICSRSNSARPADVFQTPAILLKSSIAPGAAARTGAPLVSLSPFAGKG